jgi:hypothetical protein
MFIEQWTEVMVLLRFASTFRTEVSALENASCFYSHLESEYVL